VAGAAVVVGRTVVDVDDVDDDVVLVDDVDEDVDDVLDASRVVDGDASSSLHATSTAASAAAAPPCSRSRLLNALGLIVKPPSPRREHHGRARSGRDR